MKYGQKVRVTSGFYEGLTGVVIQEITETSFGKEEQYTFVDYDKRTLTK